MFAVIFEVQPKPEQWDAYLGQAALLRPELVRVDGFIDNVRYRSTRRQGWLLSLSIWRDEAALVRWRSHALHHAAQKKGRFEIFRDYRLRVGQIVADADDSGAAALVSIVEAKQPVGPPEATAGLAGWDLFEAILTPGDFLLLLSWRDADAAARSAPAAEGRERRVRIIRDYGMADRGEAPQYFPAVNHPAGAG